MIEIISPSSFPFSVVILNKITCMACINFLLYITDLGQSPNNNLHQNRTWPVTTEVHSPHSAGKGQGPAESRPPRSSGKALSPHTCRVSGCWESSAQQGPSGLPVLTEVTPQLGTTPSGSMGGLATKPVTRFLSLRAGQGPRTVRLSSQIPLQDREPCSSP